MAAVFRRLSTGFALAAHVCVFVALFANSANTPLMAEEETAEQFDARIEWWRDARFGMFIHWGPVSLKGTEIGWSRHRDVPIAEYDQLYKKFNPVKFDADKWVAIAKSAGMKYIVLTAKHHDGFCLWDTETTDYNIMSTPFGRDVVRELADACKREGIVFCTYFSILDWYHPDYNVDSRGGPGFQLPDGQTADMDRFETYLKSQLRELVQDYGPLGVLWFDGEWEEPWTHERGTALYDYVRGLQPDILVNNRVDKGRKGMEGGTKDRNVFKGDFDTPEQRVGRFQTDWPWESCITICKQWAWKPDDKMKSLEECLHTLVRTAGGDGNLLFNVGPMADGRIEPRQVDRLREMGAWLDANGASIYGTRGGPFETAEWGASTHRGKSVYVHVLKWPGDTLELPTLNNRITHARLMDGTDVTVSQTEKGIALSVPDSKRESIDTIIVLELERPVVLTSATQTD